jgi:hypothetical protein
MKLELSEHIFEKSVNIKFHENPPSGSRVILCGQTWLSQQSLFEILRTRQQIDMPRKVVFFSLNMRSAQTRYTNDCAQCQAMNSRNWGPSIVASMWPPYELLFRITTAEVTQPTLFLWFHVENLIGPSAGFEWCPERYNKRQWPKLTFQQHLPPFGPVVFRSRV